MWLSRISRLPQLVVHNAYPAQSIVRFGLRLQTAPKNPVPSIMQALIAATRSRPLAAAVLFATTKGILADLVAQFYVEGCRLPHWRDIGTSASQQGREDIDAATYDWRRTAAMATFSGVYCGGFFYWQFSVLFPRIWPVSSATCWRSVVAQVALDNGFFSPCVYCPVFYIINGAICHSEAPCESIARYQTEFATVLRTLLTIWVPAGIVNFAFMPVWFRAPFNAIVSFAYLSILSVQSHALAQEGAQMQKSCKERRQWAPARFLDGVYDWVEAVDGVRQGTVF